MRERPIVSLSEKHQIGTDITIHGVAMRPGVTGHCACGRIGVDRVQVSEFASTALMCAGINNVRAPAAFDVVAARVAVDQVIATASVQAIIRIVAMNFVGVILRIAWHVGQIRRVTINCVRLGFRLASVTPEQEIPAPASSDHVAAAPGIHRVVASARIDHVVAGKRMDQVMAFELSADGNRRSLSIEVESIAQHVVRAIRSEDDVTSRATPEQVGCTNVAS